MDFMQCINFKSRLEREREMIRRKIRSSTLYRKPSFSKSAFNIYNPNNDVTKVSVISKNLKINEFKDEPLRKIKSPLLVNNDEPEDESFNEEKSILCIGNKYLDLTSNLIPNSISKSMSTSTINMINDERIENDFERAISQSHLSPAATPMSIVSNSLMKKPASSNNNIINSNGDVQENLKKPKTASNFNINKSLSNPFLTINNERTSDGEEDMTQSPSDKNRKIYTKIIKKSALLYNNHHPGKYSDAQKTEVALDDLPNNIIVADDNNNTNNFNNSNKTLNNNHSSTTLASNNNNNVNHTIKTVKKSATVTRKLKSSKKYSEAQRESLKSTSTRKSENS